MSPLTRFLLDAVCWVGTALLLVYWGQFGFAIVVGIVGAIYLGFAYTILRMWQSQDYDGDYDDV